MKKIMIITSLIGLTSVFISFFCNFMRGEGESIFYMFASPLWIAICLSLVSCSRILKFETNQLKRKILWMLIINSIIILPYHIILFLGSQANMLSFGIFTALALLSNLTLIFMLTFSRRLFPIAYTIFIILFSTSFITQIIMFYNHQYEFQLTEDKTAYILKWNYIEGRTITIPSTYKGLPITQIDGVISSHIVYWQNIQTINFEKDSQIIILDEYAFNGAQAKSINLPNSIQIINKNAFCGSDIVEMTIPDSVNFIGEYAFSGCIHLKEVVIPISVTTMEYNIFNYCKDITIYCEAESRPVGWSEYWASGSTNATIIWGYQG